MTIWPSTYVMLNMLGWLKPKALTWIHGNSEVKPPKAGIMLGWVPFLTVWFLVFPTTMSHSTIVGIFEWTEHFQTTIWECRGLPLEEIGEGWLVRPGLGVHLWKEEVGSLRGPSNSCDARFEITYRVRPTWRWSNTMVHHPGDNIGVNFLSRFSFNLFSKEQHAECLWWVHHSGAFGWTRYFQPTVWEPRGVLWLVFPCSRYLFLKGGSNLQRPSNSRDAHTGIICRFRPTRRWRNNVIHAGGNIGVLSLSLSLSTCWKYVDFADYIYYTSRHSTSSFGPGKHGEGKCLGEWPSFRPFLAIHAGSSIRLLNMWLPGCLQFRQMPNRLWRAFTTLASCHLFFYSQSISSLI